MDFRLSYNWLKEFVDVRLPPEELAELLSLHSVSVERIRRMDEGLDPKIVVGRVERIETHPNADKLRVVHVTVHLHPPTPPLPEGRGETKKNFSPSHRSASGGSAVGGEEERPVPARASGERVGQLVKVVCGGTNLRPGMLVAYAPPGARVRWHGQGEPVELKPTDIRGVRSDGMICAASEIGLGEYFTEREREILDLTSFLSGVNGQVSGVGQSLAAALGLDDVILDCEITTNRPDLMSVVGLAREVAAITSAKFRVQSDELSDSNRKLVTRHSSLVTSPQIRIADRRGCPRYGAVVIDGVRVGSSPWPIRRKLIAAGLRPVNNVVDATNLVMLELGQPLHAFDAAKLRTSGVPTSLKLRGAGRGQPAPAGASGVSGVEIIVRRAAAGESLAALDGETYALTPELLVIASRPSEASGGGGDAERPIALAGIIGGTESGVTEATTRIVLECANFDPMVVRKGSRALTVRTDSAIRFEKGLQPEAVEAVLPSAIAQIIALAGGVAGKPVVVGPKPKPMRPITFRPKDVCARIGAPITPVAMQRVLTVLGSRSKKKTSGFFSVIPPWWRRGDLAAAHDLVEEVARMYGYHKLPSLLPTGALPASAAPARPARTPFDTEQRARELLADVGAIEILPFTLTSAAAIAVSGYTTDQCVALENPLSEEFAYLRPSLITTMLPVIASNQGHTPNGTVFELGNIFIPSSSSSRAKRSEVERSPIGLPREEMRICVGAYGRLMGSGHVEKVKGIVEHAFTGLGIRDAEFRHSGDCTTPAPPTPLKLRRTGSSPYSAEATQDRQLPAPSVCRWHPGRTMDVVINSALVGVIGEVHPTVLAAAGIDARVAVADLDWAALLPACGALRPVEPPPAYPSVKRDLAITIDRKTTYTAVASALAAFDPVLVGFELFDQYEGGSIPIGKKSLAFHLEYRVPDRTLTADEADALHAKLITLLGQRFGAEVRE